MTDEPCPSDQRASTHIPFNRPYATGAELGYIRQAIDNNHLSGDGPFTRRCHAWLEARTGSRKALLTHSCTAALEMAALLAEIGPGDEVIMPSYTFVSTANAFVLRGGVPVFVDIRPDTLNIDEALIEDAITPRTRAIVPVHYAGVGCAMDAIMEIAAARQLLVIEDAAQGLFATHAGRPLGSIGHLGALSFHETKNIISGEGGALLVNDERFAQRAEVIREKGTNRAQFFRGEVDKYTWMDLGSSYLPSELVAAYLWAQMEHAEAIMARRHRLWARYHEAFAGLERAARLRRPCLTNAVSHNAHLYYLLFPDGAARDHALAAFKARGVNAVFHYIPLHGSPAGRRYSRTAGSLRITEEMATRLVRLPLYIEMSDDEQDRVIESVQAVC